MGELRVLHPCRRCGKSGRRRDVYFRERLACSYFACDGCLKDLDHAYAEDRVMYGAILDLLVGKNVADPLAVLRAHEVAAAMMIAKQATERAIGRKP